MKDHTEHMPEDVRAAWRAVLSWAEDTGRSVTITNPKRTKKKRKEVETVKADELDALYRAISKRSVTQIRNRAIVALLEATGLRIGEALAVRLDGLDRSEPEVWTVNVPCEEGCKTGHRLVPFSAGEGTRVRQELERWFSVRYEGEHLFTSANGNPVEYQSFARAMRTYSRRAGVRVSAHSLRHTRATELVAQGVDLPTVSMLLGHSDPSVTARTYLHSDMNRMRNAVMRVR